LTIDESDGMPTNRIEGIVREYWAAMIIDWVIAHRRQVSQSIPNRNAPAP
jgi:hypothetical protein